jgi:hypothetical protein
MKRQTIKLRYDEDVKYLLARDGHGIENYYPEEFGKKLDIEGQWVMVILPPSTNIYVHYLGIYYAIPKEVGEINLPKYTVVTKDNQAETKYCNLVKILTPQGEVCLMPSEYVPIKDVSAYLGNKADGLTINWLSPRNDNFDTDLLLYIQSRGIPAAQAWELILGTVKNQNVCYLTFSKKIQRSFAGTGVANLNARKVCLYHIEKTPLTDAELTLSNKKEVEYAEQAKVEKAKQNEKIKALKQFQRKNKSSLSWLR